MSYELPSYHDNGEHRHTYLVSQAVADRFLSLRGVSLDGRVIKLNLDTYVVDNLVELFGGEPLSRHAKFGPGTAIIFARATEPLGHDQVFRGQPTRLLEPLRELAPHQVKVQQREAIAAIVSAHRAANMPLPPQFA